MDWATQIYRYAAIVGIPIFIFGLVVNLIILYLFFFDKSFRKTSYKLMRISVVSDIISTVASLTGYVQIVNRNLNYSGGTLMCRVVLCSLFTSFGVSMMNLCLIGIDRYFIIVRPLSSYYRHNKTSILVIGEIIIWLASASINAPVLIIVGVHQNDTLLCDIPDITPSVSVFMIFHATIVFIIPTIIILILYGKIITYQKSYVRPGEVLQSQAVRNQQKKKQFVKMLTWISVSYITFSWPYFATGFGMAITGQSTLQIRQKSMVNFLFAFFTVTITTSIVILNPFLYIKFDLKVRQKSLALIRRIALCKFDKRDESVIQVTSTGSTLNSISVNRN
ncbi:uncharacterized protein TRIADDRAFT_62095 [Trichoplax adhaerens]|uniref:G-protein coupled receptors family 1 profile domain-containing protein n=1 Tax=Trichoplax adhaerens TaxID=10228 RepID=B3SCU0_TRIAD|nr:hypothetical protein TRIADDRAFT_62095 [Trichoplax adhaerens]EDV19469.1 hypothetical protein TRIADDRAFT_62095 [Trichoplax adhaerens]|eukprot:XP_002118069.1 hypothetical protein TRIADDRAFT_62095 [Trichoplax adhaerens]